MLGLIYLPRLERSRNRAHLYRCAVGESDKQRVVGTFERLVVPIERNGKIVFQDLPLIPHFIFVAEIILEGIHHLLYLHTVDGFDFLAQTIFVGLCRSLQVVVLSIEIGGKWIDGCDVILYIDGGVPIAQFRKDAFEINLKTEVVGAAREMLVPFIAYGRQFEGFSHNICKGRVGGFEQFDHQEEILLVLVALLIFF